MVWVFAWFCCFREFQNIGGPAGGPETLQITKRPCCGF